MKKLFTALAITLALLTAPAVAEAGQPDRFTKLSHRYQCDTYFDEKKGVHGWIERRATFAGTAYAHREGAPPHGMRWRVAALCSK